MKALLFPGQGSQSGGMCSDLYKKYKIVRDTFEKADETLKFKISKLILEGPEEELKLTQNTQPSILTVSYSIIKVLTEEFKLDLRKIKFYAGHSLGEYSALLSANSINFEDALKLLFLRGKYMQEAVPVGTGQMLAVLNTPLSSLEKILKETNLTECEIANDNSDGQVILSGKLNKINELQSVLKEKKIKNIILPVSAPFHCSLMRPAAEKMKIEIEKINFKKPDVDIISNVTAKTISDTNIIKELLETQIYTKVRWRETINYMIKNGVTHFIEIGPGKVLSGLVRRIKKDAEISNLNNFEDILKFSNEFTK